MVFVVLLVGVIVYTFRGSAAPILAELGMTPIWVVCAISVLAICYELVEGWITYSFARKYNPQFTYRMGVESAFYCCFYRVATLGSGAGVAAVYYFSQKGIEVSKGTGMYMVEYVIHKVTIAIFSAIFFALSWSFMMDNYIEYIGLLAAGYIITILIAAALLLFCCSKSFHRFMLWFIDKLNRKGRFNYYEAMLKEQVEVLEAATAQLLTKKSFVLSIVAKNMLKFAFWYSIPYLTLYATGEMTMIETMAVTSLSVLLAAVIPSPAGIGSSEFVLTMLLAVVVDTGLAGSATLLYRFATFVLPFAIGAIVVLIHRQLDRKNTRFQ